nr:MAG TPA: hypothetical protein [Caudoviricetes sp.]
MKRCSSHQPDPVRLRQGIVQNLSIGTKYLPSFG